MAPIDTFVLEQATKEAARWPRDVRVAVNLSPAKFKRRNLVEAVQRALSGSGLAPQRLELGKERVQSSGNFLGVSRTDALAQRFERLQALVEVIHGRVTRVRDDAPLA